MNEPLLEVILRRDYGIEPASVAPTAGGEIGLAYLVTSPAERWFVKASAPQSWYSRSIEAITGALNASAAIKPHVSSVEIVVPIASNAGTLVVESDGWMVSVYPFIQAQPVGHRRDWPDEVLSAMSRAVSEVQQAAHAVRTGDLQEDRFFLWYGRPLDEALADLAELGHDADDAQLRAQARLLPRRRELLNLADAYGRLQARVLAKPHVLVASHTDLNPGKILRDSAGRIYVVDWDDAALRAPDRDIRYLIHPSRLDLVRRAYAGAGRALVVDAETLGFFRQRDAIADLTIFIWRILDRTRTALQHERDADIIERLDWMYDGGIERDTEQVLALFK